MKMNKTVLLLLVLLSATIPLLFIMYSCKEYQLFPGKECQFFSYGDGHGDGFSRFDSAFVDDEGVLTFDAHLGSRAKYPFSGVKISHKKSHWNLKSYDSLVIIVDSTSSGSNVTLTTYQPGVSQGREPNRDRYNQMDFHTNGSKLRFVHALRNLPTPSWWYTMNKVKREDISPSDFSRVTSISFSNHPSARAGDSFHIAIREIRFVRSRKPAIVAAVVWGVSWGVIALAWWIISIVKRKSGTAIQVVQKEKHFSTRKDKVLASFEALHADTGVTISLLSKHAEVSEYHVRTILKEEFSCTFTEYLKIVRIEEAKRLLLQSDLDIKEIAYKVGFSHASSFTRAFKEIVTQSPSQFRESRGL